MARHRHAGDDESEEPKALQFAVFGAHDAGVDLKQGLRKANKDTAASRTMKYSFQIRSGPPSVAWA